MRGGWRAVLGVSISVLLIWWVLRDVEPGRLLVELRDANGWLLLAAVAVATSGFLTRALRWRVFLYPIRPGTGIWSRFAAVCIGFALNNLLPARAGELARAWSLSRIEPVPISGTLGSLVAERFLDGVAILLLLGAAVLLPGFPANATIGGRPLVGVLLTILAVGGAGVLVLFLPVIFPAPALRILDRGLRLVPGGRGRRLRELVEFFLQGLGALRDLRLFGQALSWSLAIWAWNAVSFWLAFLAFGIDRGYAAALFVQGVIALGVAVPSAPGYFGTFHAAALVGLHEVYGVAEETTLAFAFGYHLGGFFPVTFLGLWYAGRIGLSLPELGRAGQSAAARRHVRAVGGP